MLAGPVTTVENFNKRGVTEMVGRFAVGAMFLLLVGCASEDYKPVNPELRIRGSSAPFLSRHQDAGARCDPGLGFRTCEPLNAQDLR
jgi:hypothetical protein